MIISTELTSLPPLSSSSHLKKLTAENCGFKTLPENLLHPKLLDSQLVEVNLSGESGFTFHFTSKKLTAQNCGLKSLPQNLFYHPFEEINLSNNSGNDYDDNDDNDH